ncbi:MAG: prepilin-type N-terminal cleavage/methylation domain-containing protein [Candidatus Omnitrophota bacterium]|jgi:prepilin-type N-terminal cleavage/methylation domain-containing protein
MSPGYYKKSLAQKEQAFTLIELIIVIVIIGILALIALPKYYANVDRAEKSKVYASLASIRQVLLAYYAVNGAYQTSFPITVTVDGNTVVKMSNPDPGSTSWRYVINASSANCPSPDVSIAAWKRPGDTCYYALCANRGNAFQSCTP